MNAEFTKQKLVKLLKAQNPRWSHEAAVKEAEARMADVPEVTEEPEQADLFGASEPVAQQTTVVENNEDEDEDEDDDKQAEFPLQID